MKLSEVLNFSLILENIDLKIEPFSNNIIKINDRILAYYQYREYNKKSILLDKLVTSN
jgi:hypothetical protein